MVRKSIFLGLTLMLGAVLISLIVKARKEDRLSKRVVEFVKESAPTATRVISPADLRIADSNMKLFDSDDKASRGGRAATASHSVVVQNTGSVAYAGVRIEFSYLGPGGKLLGRKSYSCVVMIPPGEGTTLDNIILKDVPYGTTRSTARILSADLPAAAVAQEPARTN